MIQTELISKQLDGKIAVVTGGSSGIGLSHGAASFGSELQSLREGRPGRLRLVKLHGSTTRLIRKDHMILIRESD